MDENHQAKTESKLITTEDELWLPPLSPKDQEKLHLQKDRKKAKQTLIIIGISAAFVGVIVLTGVYPWLEQKVVIYYAWFSFDWPRWVLISLILGGVLIGIMLLILLIRVGYTAQWAGFKSKTLWDWLQLLIIPLVLAVGGYAYSTGQHYADQQRALDQQQETTLKACMDDIRDLLLKKDLATSQLGSEVRVVARAEVLSALRQLDGEHKGTLIRFLSEAELVIIPYPYAKGDVIIDLSGADLHGAHLHSVSLVHALLVSANLSGANLSNAYLRLAYLRNADLSGADLSGADLSQADLDIAHLSSADLSGADLIDAFLDGADLSGAVLRNADLRGTDLSEADLGVASLSEADLSEADLRGADLSGADLNDADLRGANLEGAHLVKTGLKGARYNTKEILVKGSQGDILKKMSPTRWPQGFNPKAVGATEENTLSGANLSNANLSNANLSNANLSNANLFGANLSNADLSNANLSYTNLSGASLFGASLSGANLSGADLHGAYLRGANVTQEQLAQAKSLKGAIMPDGSKHP